MIPQGLVSVVIGLVVLMGLSMVAVYVASTPEIYIPFILIVIAAVGGFIWMKMSKRTSNRV